MRSVVAFSLLVAAVLFAACKVKPEAGNACPTNGQWACLDEGEALYCENGTYVAHPCRGPRGCATSESGGSTCDDTLAQEGDVCISTPNPNHACSPDHKRGLVCREGRWVLWFPCKGPDGCQLSAHTVTCDSTIADMNDPCQTPGTGACSSDHKFLLVCMEGRYGRVNSCRGPKGCHIGDKAALCDESAALENDPCDTPDERTCTLDGKAQLQCKAGKYTKEKECKHACVFSSHREPPRCDY